MFAIRSCRVSLITPGSKHTVGPMSSSGSANRLENKAHSEKSFITAYLAELPGSIKEIMKRIVSFVLLCTITLVFPAFAQEPVDQTVIARIKTEGFQHSQLMDTMFYLTDVYGPRLRGSPNYKAAADWAVKKLTAWG